MSSIQEGVSCDGCMAPNFTGDRYKCLRCYDFDLCARCYTEERSSSASSENRMIRNINDEHLPTHPMQCIMTQQDFELVYRGDPTHSWDRLRVVIFTCPVCGLQGFSRERLVTHVVDEHSVVRSPTQRIEMACPICVATDFYRIGFGEYMPNYITDMVAHMQEHHLQQNQFSNAQISSNSMASSAANALSEFLRDRDFRRVIVHNMPLVNNDSDLDEPNAADGTRRGNTGSRVIPQRFDALPRVRRRILERTSADRTLMISSQDDESETAIQTSNSAVANSRRTNPPSASRPPQLDRGRDTSRIATNQNAPPFTDPSVLLQTRQLTDVAGVSNVAHRALPPSNTYARPNVPSHSSQRGARSALGGGMVTNDNNRTMGFARRLLVREHDARDRAIDSSGDPSAPLGIVLPTSRVTVRVPTSGHLEADMTENEVNRYSATIATENTTTNNNGSNADIPDGEQHNGSDMISQERLSAQASESIESMISAETKRVKYCTLFTALAKPSGLPVIKMHSEPLKRADSNSKHISTKTSDGDLMEVAEKNGGRAKFCLPGLVMRVGRPIRNTFAQRNNQNIAQNQQENESVGSDWWYSQSSHNLRTQTAARFSQPPLEQIRDVATERSINNRSEVALSRAMEVLRRLDARNVRTNRSPVSHDDGSNTGSAAYLNGNIVPPSGAIARQNQLLANALSGTLLLGAADSVAEAVAREVAAFGEVSGINMAQLQNLLHREEPSTFSTSSRASSSRISAANGQQQQQTEVKARKSTKTSNDQLTEVANIINKVFRTPEVDTGLNAAYKPKSNCEQVMLKKIEDVKNVLIPWLKREEELDDLATNFCSYHDAVIKSCLIKSSTFKNDDLFTPRDQEWSQKLLAIEKETFSLREESEEDLFNKKCESVGVKLPDQSFLVTGMFGATLYQETEQGSEYWKDSRFLRNRRDTLSLKRNVTSENNEVDVRLLKQLIFGKSDVEASKYPREMYIQPMFTRIILTALRTLIEHENDNVDYTIQNAAVTDERQIEKPKRSCAQSGHVHPDMWYFLNFGAFSNKIAKDSSSDGNPNNHPVSESIEMPSQNA